ncbi:MAG: hypothetical protein KGJ02_07990 [Verrucomicrobiota bacterium]|nr:hypothetical protein [Verrucomicrobiota bacterium]
MSISPISTSSPSEEIPLAEVPPPLSLTDEKAHTLFSNLSSCLAAREIGGSRSVAPHGESWIVKNALEGKEVLQFSEPFLEVEVFEIQHPFVITYKNHSIEKWDLETKQRLWVHSLEQHAEPHRIILQREALPLPPLYIPPETPEQLDIPS